MIKAIFQDNGSVYVFKPSIIYKNKHFPKYLNNKDKPKYSQRFVSDNISRMEEGTLYKITL
jgi:hypothetical protein